jgi:hypothetical protein
MLTIFVGAIMMLNGSTPVPELNDTTYARWRGHILPTEAERGWQEIPWRNAFWSAVIEAQAKEKPLLFWAMNGHPLACT